MTLEERVLALEVSCKKWRGRACAVLVLAIVGTTVAATLPQDKVSERIRTNRLDLVDKEGKSLCRLTSTGIWMHHLDTGSWGLYGVRGCNFFRTHKGVETMARIGMNEISLSNGDNACEIKVGSIKISTANESLAIGRDEILITNDQGAEAVTLGTDGTGSGQLRLKEKYRGKTVSIGSLPDGKGGTVKVFNKSGKVVCTLSTDNGKHGVITVLDGKGNVLGSLGRK